MVLIQSAEADLNLSRLLAEETETVHLRLTIS